MMSTTPSSDGKKPPVPLYEFSLTPREKKKFTSKVEKMITKIKKEQDSTLRKEKIEEFETILEGLLITREPQKSNLKDIIRFFFPIANGPGKDELTQAWKDYQLKSTRLKQGLSHRPSGGYEADMSVQSFTGSHSTLNMGMHQPDSHRIFDPQRGRMVDKNLYYSGGGSAPMPYTPRIDPYASQKGNQSSQSHLERLPSAGSSIGTTTWEEFEAEERRFAEWTREQRDARHDSQPRYSYGQGPSAQAYHPTITHGNDGQALSQNYGAAHMNPVAVPQGYYQPPAIQYWRSSSGEVWGNAGAGWYRVQGHQ
ncbi:hypothetical protein B0H11DRAFT_2272212 [Mycena galericulata]|nr:hypothetical protein B0H11DRAFT_2272212 [Mycena galericulata]